MSRLLDIDRVRELFDLEGSYLAASGGSYQDDPNPAWHALRSEAAIHPGTVHELSGLSTPASFHGLPEPDRQHFSAFTFAACDAVYRDPETFASSPDGADIMGGEAAITNSMLSMGGVQHRRYRSLVQTSFTPAKAEWWIRNWIEETVDLLIDSFASDGRAELNVDFCAAIPVLTITGSFGFPVEQALDVRQALHTPLELIEMLMPIVAARREQPQDDLISMLVEAEITDEAGATQRLSDPEIYSFALLLLAAGSGTTWKQMGIILNILLSRPELLDAVCNDRSLIKPVIDEAVRWLPTDPMFSRWVMKDVELFGTQIPAGSVLHLCLGAANRDPERWERPDEFDITRPPKPTLAFGGGPHICLGMHVARAELTVGLNALLDRLPNLRLDPDQPASRFVGFYERGSTALPVRFG